MNARLIVSFFSLLGAGICFAAAEPVDTLYRACKRGDCPVIKRFLAVNPELVNQRKNDLVGKTPLYYAVDNGQIEAVRVLLSHGADCKYPNGNGQTPWKCARKSDLFNSEIVWLMIEAKAMKNKDRDAMVTLLMGLHRRVGASSPVRYIGPQLMPIIYGYLTRVDIFSRQRGTRDHEGPQEEKKTFLRSIGGAGSNLMNKVGNSIFSWL